MTKIFEGYEKEEDIHIYGIPCHSQTNDYDCMLYSIYCIEALSFGTQNKDTNTLNNRMSKESIFQII